MRLTDADGLIALAEPVDGGGALKPVVGLPRLRGRLGFAAMQVTMLADVEARPRRVAVGEFDGVHLGHREVIAGSDTVLTFEPHPLAVIRPEAAPRLLTSLEPRWS